MLNSTILKFRNWWKSLPEDVRYTTYFFIFSRLILILIGVIALNFIGPFHPREDLGLHWIYPEASWLRMWGVWDTGWYLKIAQEGYPHYSALQLLKQNNFGFFPLYPLMIRIFSWIFAGNTFITGLVISNVFIWLACRYLYLLVVQSDSTEKGKKKALQSIKYFFLFPTAFILSGVNPESLFLFLVLALIYYARNKQWLKVGVLGFLATLARSKGVLLFIPILWLYFNRPKNEIKIDRGKLFYLLLFPLGFFLFALIGKIQTGDWLVYVHSQQIGWYHYLGNPFQVLWQSLIATNPYDKFDAWVALIALFVLVLAWLKEKLSHFDFLISTIFIFMVLFNGNVNGMPRYLITIYPFYLLLGQIEVNSWFDQAMIMILALLQGCLIVFWTNGYFFVS